MSEWEVLISASIALLLDREFNHLRKCLEVPIHKKLDSQNKWHIQYNLFYCLVLIRVQKSATVAIYYQYQFILNTSWPVVICALGLGGASAPCAGDDWWVAEGAGPVALPGAHLQLRGHHAADARGGTALPDRRPPLEGGHEAHGQGPKGRFRIREECHLRTLLSLYFEGCSLAF